jgi:fido (protein-threonine AMPylation protein)
MMHIETRRQGRRIKYYLAHSTRRGARVLKARLFLGSDLTQDDLSRRRPGAEKELRSRLEAATVVRDPLKTVLSDRELEQLRSLQPRGLPRISHLTEREWQRFTADFAYDTNAIEGSTVARTEVAGMLDERRWPPGRTRDEISETYGVAEAVSYIRKGRVHLSLAQIRRLHFIVFQNSLPFAGRFRARGEEVAIVAGDGTVMHRGAPSGRVVPLLRSLVDWYARNRRRYPPLVLAAVVHNRFENIHPFLDGNGRVGRLLLNNILLRHGLPPVNIELAQRSGYYRALQEYERSGNLRPMLELILLEYRRRKAFGNR